MNKYEVIAQSLKSRIQNGTYCPGQKLPSEAELCREFGASRLSVRSAIGTLAAQGVVETFQGKGSFVLESAQDDPASRLFQGKYISRTDFFELRRILETEGAGLAAQRADRQTVQRLRELAFQMQRAETEEDIAEADEQFHLLLAQATQNLAIAGVFQILQPYFRSMMTQNVAVLGADGCTAHLKIVAAIEARNSALAREHMYEHLNHTMEKTSMLNYAADLEQRQLGAEPATSAE